MARLPCICLALLLLFAGCSLPIAATSSTPTATSAAATGQTTPTATSPMTYSAQVQVNIAYGPLPGETLDLCTPQGAVAARPGIVFIHGGGWIEGDKMQYAALCILYAEQGFVVASLDYRLAPRYRWPAQLVDVQLAVRYLRSIATQITLDPARLCAWGDSAGGHLATFLGVLHTIHPGDEAGLLAHYAPDVACVVDEFGYTDLTAPLTTTLQQSLLKDLLGSSNPASNPARYRDASPIFDVSAASAPMDIIQGTNDAIVPQSQSDELLEALERVDLPPEYDVYVGGHEFAGLTADQINVLLHDAIAFVTARLGEKGTEFDPPRPHGLTSVRASGG